MMIYAAALAFLAIAGISLYSIFQAKKMKRMERSWQLWVPERDWSVYDTPAVFRVAQRSKT
jgi:hypothetical protein